MTISRSRIDSDRRRLSSYAPQSSIAVLMAGLRTNVRNSPMGSAPAGVMAVSSGSATSSNGAVTGAIRAMVRSFRGRAWWSLLISKQPPS
jgi:hypothetical protein